MAEPLLFRVENGVGWLVLNRPEARNAMNAEMRQLYLDALARCAEDAEIRAVVLTGTGKGFCTGADLSGSSLVPGRTSIAMSVEEVGVNGCRVNPPVPNRRGNSGRFEVDRR